MRIVGVDGPVDDRQQRVHGLFKLPFLFVELGDVVGVADAGTFHSKRNRGLSLESRSDDESDQQERQEYSLKSVFHRGDNGARYEKYLHATLLYLDIPAFINPL